MPKLTEAVIADLEVGRDRIVFDAGTAGFGIRITKAGQKIFIAQGRIAGKIRRISTARARRSRRQADRVGSFWLRLQLGIRR